MRIKRFVAMIMSIVILVMTTQVYVFAKEFSDEQETAKGDALAIVEIENPECLEILNLKDLELLIKAENPKFEISIPIERINVLDEGDDALLAIWLGYKEKAIEKEVLDELDELKGTITPDTMKEDFVKVLGQMENMLSHLDVSIKGLPDGHYTLDQEMTGCILVTKEIVEAMVAVIEDMIQEMYPDIRFDDIEGFSDLLDAILGQEEMTLEELVQLIAAEDPEAAKALEEMLEKLDEAVAYLTSQEFPGLLIAGACLRCNCPTTEEYEIVHEYYKNVDGKLQLVGYVYEGEDSDYDCLEGKSGDVIRAEDFINCEYKGVSYKYLGSYNVDVMYEDIYEEYNWTGYEKTEFVLGEEEVDGLLLRYEIKEDSDDSDITTEKKDAAPPTGDETNALLYIMLAAGAGFVLIVNRKKAKLRVWD